MTDWLITAFGLICGREPSHMWSPGGDLLPFCQRCAGFYPGAAVALILHLLLRIGPTGRFLLVHGIFLLVMIPLGHHWVPQNALMRAASGVLFGAGVVSFLWLFPGPRVRVTQPPARPELMRYAIGVGAALVLIPASASYGGRGAWLALVGLATIGLAGLATLVMANVGLGLLWLRLRLWRAA